MSGVTVGATWCNFHYSFYLIYFFPMYSIVCSISIILTYLDPDVFNISLAPTVAGKNRCQRNCFGRRWPECEEEVIGAASASPNAMPCGDSFDIYEMVKSWGFWSEVLKFWSQTSDLSFRSKVREKVIEVKWVKVTWCTCLELSEMPSFFVVLRLGRVERVPSTNGRVGMFGGQDLPKNAQNWSIFWSEHLHHVRLGHQDWTRVSEALSFYDVPTFKNLYTAAAQSILRSN